MLILSYTLLLCNDAPFFGFALEYWIHIPHEQFLFLVCRYPRFSSFSCFFCVCRGMLSSFVFLLRRRIMSFRLKSRQCLIGSLVTILILLQFFRFGQEESVDWKSSLGWKGYQQYILKPGDFLDTSSYDKVPDPRENVIPDETVLGITHDERYNNLSVTLTEISALTWCLQKRILLSWGNIDIDHTTQYSAIAPIIAYLRSLS